MEATEYNNIIHYFGSIFGSDSAKTRLDDGKLEITGNTPLYIPQIDEVVSALNGVDAHIKATSAHSSLETLGFREYLNDINLKGIPSTSDRIIDIQEKMEAKRESKRQDLKKRYERLSFKIYHSLITPGDTDTEARTNRIIDEKIQELLKKDDKYVQLENLLSENTQSIRNWMNNIPEILIDTEGINVKMSDISYGKPVSLEDAYAEIYAEINTKKTTSDSRGNLWNNPVVRQAFSIENISCIELNLPSGVDITCKDEVDITDKGKDPYKYRVYTIVIKDPDAFDREHFDMIKNIFTISDS